MSFFDWYNFSLLDLPNWFRRQKYWFSLTKEQKERYVKERVCHGHLYVEINRREYLVKPGPGNWGQRVYYPKGTILCEKKMECSKCGKTYYKTDVVKKQMESKFKEFSKKSDNLTTKQKDFINQIDNHVKVELEIKEKIDTSQVEIINENGFNRKFKNGYKLSEFYMKNNQYHGTLTQFYKSGEKEIRIEFVNGEQHGKVIEFYKNGVVKSEFEMKNNKHEGKQIDRFENGEISYETNYKNGLSEGIQKEFSKDGYLSLIEYHRNGEKITDLYDDNHKEIKFILLNEIKKIIENNENVNPVNYIGLISSLGYDSEKLKNNRNYTLKVINDILSENLH